MTRAALALLLALCAGAAMAQTYTGTARVIDGDTIDITDESPIVGTARIRLAGIDAPELGQLCHLERNAWQKHPYGAEINSLALERQYECGRDSAAVLTELVRGRTVACVATSRDKYGRVVATCWTDAGDIGAAMVERGWATRYARYDPECRYCAAEATAKAAKLGIWSSRFTVPEEFGREPR